MDIIPKVSNLFGKLFFFNNSKFKRVWSVTQLIVSIDSNHLELTLCELLNSKYMYILSVVLHKKIIIFSNDLVKKNTEIVDICLVLPM